MTGYCQVGVDMSRVSTGAFSCMAALGLWFGITHGEPELSRQTAHRAPVAASATPVLPGSMRRGHPGLGGGDLVENKTAAAETRYLHTHLLFHLHGLNVRQSGRCC